jgi:hypothetical protein
VDQRILIATRKGLFIASSQDTSWEIKELGFIGDPVTMVLAGKSNRYWYAALNLGHFGVKLHRSPDEGKSWEEIPAPRFPKQVETDSQDPGPSVSLIWALETAGPDEPDGLWAGTIPGGLFRSNNNGESWDLNQPLWDRPERADWFGGGYDSPGIHSISVDPRDSRSVVVGVSCGGAWLTQDGGATWSLRATGMRAEYMPEERAYEGSIQDPHRLVRCQSDPDRLWVQHHNGIFVSEDSGATWRELTEVRPSSFGFAVAVNPQNPDMAWFVPAKKDECRVPVNGRFVVTRTTDGGRSFEVLSSGLPDPLSYDLVFRHALDVDSTGNQLAMGSTTGSFWVSQNQGNDWVNLSRHLPPIYCVRFVE